jgi:predicted RNA methylase
MASRAFDAWYKLRKLTRLVGVPLYRRGLRFGVAAAIEHDAVLGRIDVNTIIDVGANTGQFALVARRHFAAAQILSFEPLAEARG